MIELTSFTGVSALSLAVHIPEKYTDVAAGERLYFEIEVKYPENPSRKDLRLEYEITTIEGELIAQSKVLKAVETQASFVDFIIIPESAETGLHKINVVIKDYEGLEEEISASFNIIGGKSDQIKIYFFALFGFVIFLGILVIVDIFFLRKRRN